MRLRSMAIFGIGYLVGTRAGRDRYQQIAESVREVAESDVVRGYVDRAFDMARRPLDPPDESDDTSEEAATDEATEGKVPPGVAAELDGLATQVRGKAGPQRLADGQGQR